MRQIAGSANAKANSNSTPMRSASNSRYCTFFASTRRGSPGSKKISELNFCLFGLSDDSRCNHHGNAIASNPAKNAGASKLMSTPLR